MVVAVSQIFELPGFLSRFSYIFFAQHSDLRTSPTKALANRKFMQIPFAWEGSQPETRNEAQNNRTNEVASNKVSPEHARPHTTRSREERPAIQAAKTTALDGVQREAMAAWLNPSLSCEGFQLLFCGKKFPNSLIFSL